MRHEKRKLILGLLVTGTLVWGCGSQKRIESTEVPTNPGSNEKASLEKASLTPSGHYLVRKHDCLWTIAGQPRIYNDSFQWPLLFKANRDEIKDPDLIYPRQDLRVEKGVSPEEVNHAKQMAMNTPKYEPHSKPRGTLPLDYF